MLKLEPFWRRVRPNWMRPPRSASENGVQCAGSLQARQLRQKCLDFASALAAGSGVLLVGTANARPRLQAPCLRWLLPPQDRGRCNRDRSAAATPEPEVGYGGRRLCRAADDHAGAILYDPAAGDLLRCSVMMALTFLLAVNAYPYQTAFMLLGYSWLVCLFVWGRVFSCSCNAIAMRPMLLFSSSEHHRVQCRARSSSRLPRSSWCRSPSRSCCNSDLSRHVQPWFEMLSRLLK